MIISEGDKIALQGKNGSGKTSLVRILLKLYDIDSGKILINGIDLNNIPLYLLRNKIAYIPQNISLFSDTIKNNITMNNRNITEIQITEIVKLCELEDTIARYELGIDTVLNEKGSNLSGGEKQKIAIARGLLSDPDVIILDEATSNIDNKSEKNILHNIFKEYSKKTFIIISHSQEALQYCNRIIVLEEGQISRDYRTK